VKRPVARGNWSACSFPDLEGAVKDVELMERILSSDKLGFKDMVVLEIRAAQSLEFVRHKALGRLIERESPTSE
jgi:hypothetical protein